MKKTITSGLLWLFAAVVFSAQAQSYYATKILDFLPAPGQFVNTPTAPSDVIGKAPFLLSLGSFGGYIVFGFERPIVNDPQNPYGVDFSIEGNSFGGNLYGQWCEPGAVQVMKDINGDGLPNDGEWYELAGSDYYLSSTQRNVTLTYYNPHYDIHYTVPWSTGSGERGALVVNRYHMQPYYPDPFGFGMHILDSVSFTGNKIRGAIDMSNPGYLNPYRAPFFGYCDSRGNNNPLTNPQNPYTVGNDGFDLSWAVDKDDNHVELDTVHFVRVYNAGFANIGWLGEWSTEVRAAAITIPDPNYVPQDYYINYIGINQLQVLKGQTCKYEGILFKNGIPQSGGIPRWWTSNPDVGTVDDEGNFTAHELGETTLYFSQNEDISADYLPIKVVELRSVVLEMEGNNYARSSDSTSLLVNEKAYIVGECEDNRGRFVYELLEWTTSRPEIGEIDNGLFTAFAPGRTMVYARSTSAPDLQDSILVIVNPLPEVTTVKDYFKIPSFAAQGTFKSSELFTTGVNAGIILNDAVPKSGNLVASIEKNQFLYSFTPGLFTQDTVRFNITVFKEKYDFDIIFNYMPAVFPTGKQIVFVHENDEGVQSVRSYSPESEEIKTFAALGEAETISDMQVDGAYLFAVTGSNLYRDNLSSGQIEDQLAISYAARKALVYENRLYVTGTDTLYVYAKSDLTPYATIGFPAEATAMALVNGKIYVTLNSAGTSGLAILNAGLNTVTLEKTIDWGTEGLNVSDLLAKGDMLYAVRKNSSTAPSAIIRFHTGDETHTVTEIPSVECQSVNTSAVFEPLTGDTILLKNKRGFTPFDTRTMTLGAATYMRDNARYPSGTAYDPEQKQYYIAYLGASDSRGAVFSSALGIVKNFDELGAAPAILRFCPALSGNERPEMNAAIASIEIVERKASLAVIINKANTFNDEENNFRIYPKTFPSFLTWERSGDNLRYSAFFDGQVTADSTITVEVEAIDHYGSATTAGFTLVIKPRIYSPQIATPVLDRNVTGGTAGLSLYLGNLFEFFPANVGARNLKSVQANTRPDLVTAVIDETTDSLRLSFAPRLSGEALITLRGTTEETAPDEPGKPESKYVDFTFTVIVEAGTSIPVTPEAKPRIYPNPFAGYIILDTATGGKLVIYDLFGKAVFATSAKPGSSRIDVSALSKGVYLLKHGTKTIKIVK
jgi:hypothetical protein